MLFYAADGLVMFGKSNHMGTTQSNAMPEYKVPVQREDKKYDIIKAKVLVFVKIG